MADNIKVRIRSGTYQKIKLLAERKEIAVTVQVNLILQEYLIKLNERERKQNLVKKLK